MDILFDAKRGYQSQRLLLAILGRNGTRKSLPMFTQEQTFDVRVPLSGVIQTHLKGGQKDRF
jgi:hypothetical protein